MKKVLLCCVAFILCFQMIGFAADYTVTVNDKSTSGADVSIESLKTDAVVGVWADFNDAGEIVNIKTENIVFTDGSANLKYTGSFTNLKFMVFKDLSEIKPLCGATEINCNEIVFDQKDGIEDLGDFEI